MLLVVHVVQQHQRQRHVAHTGEADQRDRARHGGDGAAAGMAKRRAVHQAQQLVRQRHVFQDFGGQAVQAFVVRRRDALDAGHRIRQRRKIALVAHAPQQEVERAVRGRRGRWPVGGLHPGVERRNQRACAVEARTRRARNRALHDRAQAGIEGIGLRQHDVFVHRAVQRAVRVALLQQRAADQQLAQHHAGGEHVHRRRRRQALRGFGRHVAGRADRCARTPSDTRAGDAEVHHAGATVRHRAGCSTASGRGARCLAHARRAAPRARHAAA